MAFRDLTGLRFGRLVVLGLDEEYCKKYKRRSYWRCKCDCGGYTTVTTSHLLNGHSKSCGCLARETASKLMSKRNKYYFNDEYNIAVGFLNNAPGEYFTIDKEDYDIVKDRCWYKNHKGYVSCSKTKDHDTEKMHRVIMSQYQDITGKEIDHENHNKKDNRKTNIRESKPEENSRNRCDRKNNSGERNIFYNKKNDIYEVNLHFRNVDVPRASFKDKNEAITYRDYYNKLYATEFDYNPATDVRNISYVNSDGIIYPFFHILNYQPIINPFNIIDEDKFYGNKEQ